MSLGKISDDLCSVLVNLTTVELTYNVLKETEYFVSL
jgi:hypothetical protein